MTFKPPVASTHESPLSNVYGDLLVVRPPVPATCNKAGANYKSEVTHLEYFPQRAFDEWQAILEAILECGGDAVFQFEAADDPYLGFAALRVDGDGNIFGDDSKVLLGNLATVETGRVFAANGPWVVQRSNALVAVLPHMLPHRRSEVTYYKDLLAAVATETNQPLQLIENPHRWEGMADVAVVGDRVILTYAVSGHYDQHTTPKSSRSSREGVEFVATQLGVTPEQQVFAELVYPHFHGDTVHFGVRAKSFATGRAAKLAHYPAGLWNQQTEIVVAAIGSENVVPISQNDAVEQYAGNSRQVNHGVLVPDGVSNGYIAALHQLGLSTHKVPLFELFGKAGGGPACATLYLPKNLALPKTSALRYSNNRDKVTQRRGKIPQRLLISPDYFAGKTRG